MTDDIPASITVRDATPEDRPQLVGFMADLNAYEHALQPDRALGEKAADAHLAYLESLVARQRGFVLVAEESGGVQGFLLGIVEEEDGSYVIPEARPYGYVTDLFITEIARGRGVGRALMGEAERRFRDAGLPSIRVTALAANEGACGTYEGLGYQHHAITFIKPLDQE